MLNTETSNGNRDEDVHEIVAAGPNGALALAGIASAIVIAIWVAFYLLIFLPRGALQ